MHLDAKRLEQIFHYLKNMEIVEWNISIEWFVKGSLKRTDPVLKAPTQGGVWGRITRDKSYSCNIMQRGCVESMVLERVICIFYINLISAPVCH
jgi:hypothetical protein